METTEASAIAILFVHAREKQRVGEKERVGKKQQPG